MIQKIYKAIFFSFLIPVTFIYAQNVPWATSTTYTTSTVCTGNIMTDQGAAQACVDLAQKQGTSLGYDMTCSLESVGLPSVDAVIGTDHYYNGVCTVNGTPGHSAYLLAGYQAQAGSNALIKQQSPGWTVLSTELKYDSAYTACGDKAPYFINGAYTCSAPTNSGPAAAPTSTTLAPSVPQGSSVTTVTTHSTSPDVVAQNTYQNIISSNAQSSQAVLKQINGYMQTLLGSSLVNPSTLGTSASITGHVKGSGSSSGSATCHIFSGTYSLGDTGRGVDLIITTLKNAGFLRSVTPTSFNSDVRDAVIAYQEKNADSILVPLGLSSGTGVVSTKTNASFTKQCLAYDSVGAVVNVGVATPASLPGLVRYIRVTTTKNEWVSWREVEVYTRSGVKIPLASSQISASSFYKGDWQYPPVSPEVVTNLIDGNQDTKWNAGETNPACNQGVYPPMCVLSLRTASFTIDLGQPTDVSKIRLQQTAERATFSLNTAPFESVLIDGSNDGKTYNTVGSFSGSFTVDHQWTEFPSLATTTSSTH